MASEDSDQLVAWFPSVHRLRDFRDLRQPFEGCVATGGNQFDAVSELLEVELLRAAQGVPLEERNDRLQQILTPANDVASQVLPMVVGPSVWQHLTYSKELTQLVETLGASFALRHCELVSDLVSGSVAASTGPASLADEADREASFSVYETDYPATELDQPFLLVFRTRHVVTLDVTSDATSSAGYTGFSSI